MNLPFVSRRRYDQALQQIAQARLELGVAQSELRFERDSGRRRLGMLTKAAQEISALRKEAEGWRKAYCELQGAEIVGVE